MQDSKNLSPSDVRDNDLYKELKTAIAQLQQQNHELELTVKRSGINEARYRALVENSPDMVYSCDVNGKFTAVNKKFCEVTGLTIDKVIGSKISTIIKSEEFIDQWKRSLPDLRKEGKTVIFDHEIVLPDGSGRIFTAFLTPVFDANKKVIGITGTNHDITEIIRHEHTIGHLANYDALTDLPNRLLFMDRLNAALHHARRTQTKVAVFFLDLDNFKKINDTFGHFIGDDLIKTVSKTLTGILRKDEVLARFSGDEFTIFIQDINSKEDILCFIDRVKDIFSHSYDIGSNTIHIGASIGVAIFPDDGDSCDELLKNADTAMYKAKEQGKNNYQFYDHDMRNEVFKKLMMEGHLANALKKNEFSLDYDPLIKADSGKIRGCEALLRWNSPILGSIPAPDFIWLAEETGLINPIGEWVLKTACAQNKEWHQQYGIKTIVSVHISALQLEQKNFTRIVREILDETGLGPEFLELEITESLLINSLGTTTKLLEELKRLGVRISLADFGTGYSSLNYLKNLPLNTLKIDKTFIEDIRSGTIEKSIIESIIALVHTLNLEIVAEGVETKEQWQYLMEAKCDYVQGPLIYEPGNEQGMTGLLNTGGINLVRLFGDRYNGMFI